jgi:hypothetical protein
MEIMMPGSTLRVLRCCACAALLSLAIPVAHAADYTDLWWNPAESGWGVNIVQSDAFMFLTFFIYGQDRKPTWYTAALNRDASGAYSGGLYLTGGSYYAVPWNTADSLQAQQVGSAVFTPSSANNYQATLTYVVDGVGTVTKAIERQTLTVIPLGGAYIGGISASQTSCNDPSGNGAYQRPYELQVTHTPGGGVTFAFDYTTFVCTLSGTLAQHGNQYTVSGASYRCTGGFSGTADMTDIKATAQGVEGRWASATGRGCQETAKFSAVLR